MSRSRGSFVARLAVVMVAAVVFLFLVSCTVVPPGPITSYQQKESMSGGEGYSEMKLGDNSYRVTFSGNQFTEMEIAQKLFLMRCAELAKNNNYTHFHISKFEDHSTRHTVHTAVATSNTTAVGTSNTRIKPSFTGDVQLYNGAQGIEEEYSAADMWEQGIQEKTKIDEYNVMQRKAAVRGAWEYIGLYLGVGILTVLLVYWLL